MAEQLLQAIAISLRQRRAEDRCDVRAQVFLVAAAKLGVPATRCVVFEDAVAGVEAAQAGGMKCVAVSFVGHHPAAKLQAAGADLVVPSLELVSVDEVQRMLASGPG